VKLTIIDVAREAGVHKNTVRNLEKRGLIAAERDCNGWRRYSPQVEFIFIYIAFLDFDNHIYDVWRVVAIADICHSYSFKFEAFLRWYCTIGLSNYEEKTDNWASRSRGPRTGKHRHKPETRD
jgi:hypothetical protein